jgi:hypothetical protein
VSNKEWYGVDLDRTLAHYEPGDYKKFGPNYIGAPIAPMVERVKQMLAEGKDVRIFTARVSIPEPGTASHCATLAERFAREWEVIEFKKHLSIWLKDEVGQDLPVTCVKDYDMVVLYDDRARQVVANVGTVVGE